MNKLILVAIMLALVLSACSVPKPQVKTLATSDSIDSVDDVSADLTELDSLDEDLNIEDFESLDQELAELEALNFE